MGSSRPVALAIAASLAVWAGCERRVPESAAVLRALFSGETAEWIDMSHTFDSTTVYWPTSQPFRLQVVAAGVTPAGFYYAANSFCTAEHGGTHLDAPVHFAEGRHAADQIPLDQFIGPAVVVDVSAQSDANPDYLVTVADIQAWESRNGRIPDGAIVLFRTGWGRFWPDRARYLGTALTGEAAVPQLHFPGLHPDAARWLVSERKIDAVGIDTPSIDFGQSTRFESHRILFAANVPAFENVASLDRLPETDAYVVALPMKIGGGTGGPLRMVGIVPRG